MALTPAELVARRSSALGRDPSLGGQSPRTGCEEGEGELRVTIEELYALAMEAERGGLPAAEVARTWRGLGDAWLALARRGEPRLLENVVDAYRRAERVLTRSPDAIEGAELDLALATAFFELARGTDTSLLRRADARLERSLHVFRRQVPERAPLAALALERTRAALDGALATGDASDSLSEPAQQTELLRMVHARLAGEAGLDGLAPLRRVDVEAQLRAIDEALATVGHGGEAAHLGTARAREVFKSTRPRASCGDPRIDWLEDALKAELPRPMRPQTDRESTRQLLMAARRLADEAAHARPGEEVGRAAWDARVFRLAVQVQAHLRRFHLMLAAPGWTSRPVEPRSDQLFFAGRRTLAEALQRICAARGLALLGEPAEGARSAELLWNQLRASAGAVIDLGDDAGTSYYGLAMAITLGTPTALLAPRALPLPLEIEGCPLVLFGDEHDTARLDAAIDLAVCRPRCVSSGTGSLGDVVAELERLSATSPAPTPRESALIQSARLAANAADPAACRAAVEAALVGLSPVAVAPWYPATYPPPASRPRRLLHAAGPRGISSRATGAVESACVSRGFSHVPLDGGGATPGRPRSVLGLWRHIGAAHAILADLTDHDPVVTLIVGIARSTGKPVQIMVESPAGGPAPHRPDSFLPLPRETVPTWSDGAQLHELVGQFLTAVVRSERVPAPGGQR